MRRGVPKTPVPLAVLGRVGHQALEHVKGQVPVQPHEGGQVRVDAHLGAPPACPPKGPTLTTLSAVCMLKPISIIVGSN